MQDLHVRPDWTTYFMGLAKQVSLRGTCRVQVGAVVTIDNRVVLTGYNGSAPGQPHCSDVGCLFYGYMSPGDLIKSEPIQYQPLSRLPFTKRCMRTIHAEQNVIGIAAKNGISLSGATWYLYPFGPCNSCQMLLATTSPQKIVWTAPKDSFAHYSEATVLQSIGVQTEVIDALSI